MPYVIPESGATVVGALGYLACGQELAEQVRHGAPAFDTVVITYTLCTIREPIDAVREMARVLAPRGRVLFCEHGLAPDDRVRRWQRRMNPLWGRLGGGCHLDRDIPSLLRAGGLSISWLETMYLPGWRPAAFNYWGEAEAA